jgi:hypothetical protein
MNQLHQRFLNREPNGDVPTIVCLCGSTKFREQFMIANYLETMLGRIVLSVGFFMHTDNSVKISSVDKLRLDELHLRKIDLSDEVLCINVNDYVGDSTKRELWYAQHVGRHIRFVEMPTRYTPEVIREWFPRLEDWEKARIEAARV